MPQSSTTLSSLLQSQIEPGALLRRQTHLQRSQVGSEFLRRAAPYQRIDVERLAQHLRQRDLRDAQPFLFSQLLHSLQATEVLFASIGIDREFVEIILECVKIVASQTT